MTQETPETSPAETAEPSPDAGRPGRRPSPRQVPASLVPETGWHFLHLFYHVDRDAILDVEPDELDRAREEFVAILGTKPEGVEQLQCFAVPGHKADFGVMLAGTDLKAIHGVQTALAASLLGPALTPSYSFYSITEVSEYVPDAEQYAAILRDREKLDPESPMFQAKVASYSERLGPMNQHRLYPEFPDWPCFCFYPMSKMRQGEQNWYLLPFEQRSELMAQHGRSGMAYAGKVSQVITASTGLDDWEWGVTLWARNPLFLKDIVYTMRFDESSAKYALFGDFYFGYIVPPRELVEVLRI
ncbi:hydrogen peroxide-dependent heme synthase [Paludisphaera soli]|uniref:hydrogen peroxide-dependent heme synthase n=1 Tax=Paludisphaera soli TaxID=2712865 RepID=UPI0013EA0C9A|nr:hydrogen peroxide-dependent heme synthase [Paludisphaera soli]